MNTQVQKKQTVMLRRSCKFGSHGYSLFFNGAGSRLLTADYDIKIWNFQSTFKLLRKLQLPHRVQITSFVLSKRANWFVFGNAIGQIQCWKELLNGDWISAEPINIHTSSIRCVLLNKKENELITCSFNNPNIIIWKVNCQTNQLKHDYCLEDRMSMNLYSICMNELETYLVSYDYQWINLYKKSHLKKWQYEDKKFQLKESDQIFKIWFISNCLAWKQQKEDIVHIFEIKNDHLLTKPELNLQEGFNKIFPSIKYQVYVLNKENYFQEQQDGKFKLIQYPINLSILDISFQITNENREYLIIKSRGEFKVYKLQFQ